MGCEKVGNCPFHFAGKYGLTMWEFAIADSRLEEPRDSPRRHGGTEEEKKGLTADGFTAENAELRRGKKMGTGNALRAGCLGKWGLESRLWRAFHPLFPETTAQPSRRAIPFPLCGLGGLCG